MAAPANRFDKVQSPDPNAITVTVRPGQSGEARGEVIGPDDDASGPISIGQDGSLTAHQALAVACHLANRIDRPVVVRDDDALWQPAWGSLQGA